MMIIFSSILNSSISYYHFIIVGKRAVYVWVILPLFSWRFISIHFIINGLSLNNAPLWDRHNAINLFYSICSFFSIASRNKNRSFCFMNYDAHTKANCS